MSNLFLPFFIASFNLVQSDDCYNCTECGCRDSHYFVNFANSTKRELSNDWTFEDDCNYCTGLGPEGDQCTFMNRQYFDIEANGMVFTTTKLENPSDCGAECASAHIQLTDYVLFGTFIISAQFFFGEANTVKTATGIIGLNHDDNTDGITFSFHGKGWIGDDNDWNDRFATNCYDDRVNVGKLGSEIYQSTQYDIANEMNEYKIVWTPQSVEWYFNDELIRSTVDPKYVPKEPLQPRLNTRSSACDKLKDGKSFTATFGSFEYIPYADGEHEIVHTTEYESSFESNGLNDGETDNNATLLIVVLSVSVSILCIACIALSIFRNYKRKKAETKRIVHNIRVESNEMGISKDMDGVTTDIGGDVALPEDTKGMDEGNGTETTQTTQVDEPSVAETVTIEFDDDDRDESQANEEEIDADRISLEMEQMKMEIAEKMIQANDLDPVIEEND